VSGFIDDEEFKAVTGGWDHASLPKNIRVGADCFLERKDSFKRFRSTREPGLVLGDRVKVYTWTEFNIEPAGIVEVGNDSVLVGAVFMCAENVRIGQRAIVSYNVTIADSDFHPREPGPRKLDAIANAPEGDRSHRPAVIAKPVVIEDDVWIGIGAIILKGVHIGRGARVGAGAVVAKDVPAGASVAGNPARPVVDGSFP
jgi:acetyltransferase-like isoleucine patch superfamily enzyme